MQTLRQKLLESHRFLIAAELVSVRGSMAEKSAIKARGYASELVANPAIDWISITDNAGGNPQLAPLALGVLPQTIGWIARSTRIPDSALRPACF